MPCVDDTLLTCGRALRLWLIGKLVDMAIVGILVWLGTWMIGLPGPLALALFAAVTEFIPIIGRSSAPFRPSHVAWAGR